MNINTVKKPEELLGDDYSSSSYLFDNFIKVESMLERFRSKKKLKLLQAVDPVVSQILDSDEQVYYVTQGLRVTTIDSLLIGWVAYYYNLFCFIFTTRRIILVHLTRGTTRGKYICEINYENLMKVSGFGKLKIKFRNGKSLLLAKVPRYDRKFIKEFMKSVLPDEMTQDKKLPSIKNLCPSCYADVVSFPKNCTSCNVGFKEPKKAALLSLLMPGLGDLYLGSKFLGIIELLFMLSIWFSFISGAVQEASAGGSIVTIIIPLAVMLLFIHGIDALKSSYVARKGIAIG